MTHVRKMITLKDMGIEAIRAKKSMTGALLLEIPGEGSRKKAEELADKMREVLAGKEGVMITCPQKKGELRLKGLDQSVTQDDVLLAVAEVGACSREEISVGEIKFSARGLGTAWMRCPLGAANKLAKAGSLTVGWCRAKVEELKVRPLTCFRCL